MDSVAALRFLWAEEVCSNYLFVGVELKQVLVSAEMAFVVMWTMILIVVLDSLLMS
jgi:hypothetical protein